MSIANRAGKLLAIPDDFRRTAMSFPDKVKQALSLLNEPAAVAELLNKAEAFAIYSQRIRADIEHVNAIQYGKLLIEARLGELLPTTGGRPKKGEEKVQPPCNLSHTTITAYRKVAAHSAELEPYLEAVQEANKGLPPDSPEIAEVSTSAFIRYVGSDGNIKATQNRGVIEWFTPAEYVELARVTMGSIDLDPASNAKANKVVKAATFHTKSDDGLCKEWNGNVFLNPPFQAQLIQAFIAKLCESVTAKTVSQAVLLTNNNTDTRWWHQAAEQSQMICFTLGRVAFYSPVGAIASPTNGHTFFYFGNRTSAFKSHFGTIGTVLAKT